MSSRRSSVSNSSSNQSVQILTDALALSMRMNRIGPLEVEVFLGNPLEYVGWAVAFKNLIESSAVPESDRLHYLKKYVGGPAKEAIRGYFLLSNTSAAYVKAMSVLKNRFGSDFAIAESFRERLEAWPTIRDSDYKGIQKYADFLGQCLTAMETIEELSILNDSKQNVVMASKLPGWLANSWKRRAVACRNDTGKYPKFQEFVSFLSTESDILNDPFMSKIGDLKSKERSPSHKAERPLSHVRQTLATAKSNNCSICYSKSHRGADCPQLREKPYSDVRKKALELKLCFRCFKPGHRAPVCKHPAECLACGKLHPTILHNKFGHDSSPLTLAHKAAAPVELQSVSATLATTRSHNQVATMSSMILPVWVSTGEHPNKEALCYALLDTMSDSTWMTNSIASSISAVGQAVSLSLTTMTSKDEIVSCRKFSNINIRGYTSKHMMKLPQVYSRDSIPVDRSHIPTSTVARNFKHLLEIADQMPERLNIPIGLLIGYDAAYAMFPECSLRGDDITLPYAVKTPLGWCIVGTTQSSGTKCSVNRRLATIELSNPNHVANEPASVVFRTTKEVLPAPNRILDVFEQDFLETALDQSTIKSLSQDDEKFISLLNEGLVKTESGSFQMPLPFKQRPIMPNNKSQVMKRLLNLRCQLRANKQYLEDYVSFMNDIIACKHAEEAPIDSHPGETWFIPHFGVRHHKKKRLPTGCL